MTNFFFNNNDFGVIVNADRIHPSECIANSSTPHPAYKLLGVYLDENMSFDYQTKSIVKKVSKVLFSLRNAKNLLTEKALRSIYYGLIHPHFLYCLLVSSCFSQKNLNLHFLKQK